MDPVLHGGATCRLHTHPAVSEGRDRQSSAAVAVNGLLEVMALEQLEQVRAVHLRRARGPRDVALGAREQRREVALLELLQDPLARGAVR